MKKLLAAMLMTVVISCCSYAFADTGSKMIFDDVALGKACKIKGYASVTFLSFNFVNIYAQWNDGQAGYNLGNSNHPDSVYSEKPTGWNPAYVNCGFKNSGNEAEFAWLKADVINLQKSDANFMKDISVKVIYDDEYEYTGWVRQFNYDYSKSEIFTSRENTPVGWPVCLSPVDELLIGQMYKGHYVFGCTLPNTVVEDESSPLRMVITIGRHELTYNIRK